MSCFEISFLSEICDTFDGLTWYALPQFKIENTSLVAETVEKYPSTEGTTKPRSIRLFSTWSCRISESILRQYQNSFFAAACMASVNFSPLSDAARSRIF